MNNKVLMIIGVVVLVAVGAFVLMQSQNNNQRTDTSTTDQTVTQTPTDDSTMEQSADDSSMSENEAGSEDTLSESDTNDADANVKTFKVSASNFAFDVKNIEVKKGDTVKIEFTNSEGMHDWVIDEFNAKTKVLQAGQTETVEFVADEAGEFEYYCSVGQHRQMGMVGKLVVEE